MNFVMPTRTLDYLLMGIAAGIIAGIILVYIAGITFFAMLQAVEGIKSIFQDALKTTN